METNTIGTRWSNENVIELLRKLRNDLIKDFLDERLLREYVSKHFRINDLSNIKIELIKRDLKELLISPVDIHHYKPIISQIHESDSAALTESNEQLFFKELENLFKRYLYQ
jgi:hypothetical protein